MQARDLLTEDAAYVFAWSEVRAEGCVSPAERVEYGGELARQLQSPHPSVEGGPACGGVSR